MTINVNVTNKTAAWLQQKAQEVGMDQSSVAARVLDELADRELGRRHAPDSLNDWVREFDRWTASLRGCGGRADPSRVTIYD